jgi:3-dehydroquinate synthase
MIQVKIPAIPAMTYPIIIGAHVIRGITKYLPKNTRNIVIITDKNVKKLFAQQLSKHLKKLGYKILIIAIQAGETAKNRDTKAAIETKMLENKLDRATVILALGGGVVGDIAGFVAATYMRGIAFIQIPTTLLAMVDSSIGGKTGIDTPQGKNLLGAFWQPKAVIANLDFLNSLPKQQLINGSIEALKMFLTHDKNSFTYAAKNLVALSEGKLNILKTIINNAIQIKAAVVARDPHELHERMTLNFGHTIGHALEFVAQYKILHGFAVALGILVEAKISQLSGLLTVEDYIIIQDVFKILGITSKQLKNYDINKIIAATKLDKKAKGQKVRYILLKNIGAVYQQEQQYAHVVTDSVVKKALLLVSGA